MNDIHMQYEYTNIINNNLCNCNVIIRGYLRKGKRVFHVDIREYQLILDQIHFGNVTSLITLMNELTNVEI